jgi:hypothetical protein
MTNDNGFEFDPRKADEAERLLRDAGDQASEARLESGTALSSVHQELHPFGTSPEAQALAAKWDTQATARSTEAGDVSAEAYVMADKLQASSGAYQQTDLAARDRFDEIHRNWTSGGN